jgi:hypothetical protein
MAEMVIVAQTHHAVRGRLVFIETSGATQSARVELVRRHLGDNVTPATFDESDSLQDFHRHVELSSRLMKPTIHLLSLGRQLREQRHGNENDDQQQRGARESHDDFLSPRSIATPVPRRIFKIPQENRIFGVAAWIKN